MCTPTVCLWCSLCVSSSYSFHQPQYVINSQIKLHRAASIARMRGLAHMVCVFIVLFVGLFSRRQKRREEKMRRLIHHQEGVLADIRILIFKLDCKTACMVATGENKHLDWFIQKKADKKRRIREINERRSRICQRTRRMARMRASNYTKEAMQNTSQQTASVSHAGMPYPCFSHWWFCSSSDPYTAWAELHRAEQQCGAVPVALPFTPS